MVTDTREDKTNHKLKLEQDNAVQGQFAAPIFQKYNDTFNIHPDEI